MTAPNDPEHPTEADAEILALMQADENDEAVYGWMVEESEEKGTPYQRARERL